MSLDEILYLTDDIFKIMMSHKRRGTRDRRNPRSLIFCFILFLFFFLRRMGKNKA